MNGALSGRTVVVGVTGGIAAYKACEVVSRLKKLGADVRVILTENAARFVPPLTFQALSGAPVADGMFEQPAEWDIKHISWAKAADLFIVAPATANLIAKHAHGIADDMLTSTLLATRAPLLIAPAMNVNMWRHPATQENLATLRARGAHTVGPGKGYLACGDVDEGRMAEPVEIVDAALAILLPSEEGISGEFPPMAGNLRFPAVSQDLAGKRVLVTAGPTREALDPIRFITNRSSGKMGYAIAEAAAARGAQVTLVTGPVNLTPPTGVTVVPIVTTGDLFDAVTSRAAEQDAIIQAAAPCDFAPEAVADQKIKKTPGGQDGLMLSLVPTRDVAQAVGAMKKPGQFLVAFAAETENLIENAQKKLEYKRADLVVANDVAQAGAGFDVDTNIASLVTRGGVLALPRMTKRQLADEILNAIATGAE